MNSKNAPSLITEKLRACGLFSLYSQAFQLTTGLQLDFSVEPAESQLAVPIRVGEVEAFNLVAKGESTGREKAFLGLLQSFALQLEDELNRAVLESQGMEPENIKGAKAYICEHLGEKFELDKVAEYLGECPYQLCRHFKKHTGMTMTEYLCRQRVERARKALQNLRYSITEVASDSGFTSISQFNRSFLKYAGESPSRYRERQKTLEHCDLAAA